MFDETFILYLGRHTLETALLVSAPILAVCLIVGVVVSLIQAVTSIKDMTLSTVPKLVAVGATGIIFGNWMLQLLMKFTIEIFNQIQMYGH